MVLWCNSACFAFVLACPRLTPGQQPGLRSVGLHVTFANLESVTLYGMEGDDEIYVQSTDYRYACPALHIATVLYLTRSMLFGQGGDVRVRWHRIR